MATANVVFRIGSMADLAGLQAGVQMVGQLASAIKDVGADAEKFGRVYRRLEIDIAAADAATSGLIDTMNLMTQANALSVRQLDVSDQALANIGKVAAHTARKLGTDVDTEFKKLTNSIIKGNERGLIPLGIELDETEDKALASAEALEKVSAMGEQMADVMIEDVGEGMFALNNDLDTAIGLLWTKAGEGSNLGSAFQAVHEVLAGFNTMVDKHSETLFDSLIPAFDDAAGWLDTMKLGLDITADAFRGSTKAADNFADALAEDARRARELDEELDKVLADFDQFAGMGGTVFEATAAAAETARTRTSRKKTTTTKGGGRRKKQEPVDPFQQYYRDDPRLRGTNATPEDLALMGGPVDEDSVDMGSLYAPSDEDLERSREMLSLHIEIMDLRMAEREAELSYAQEWHDAWVTSYEGFRANTLVATASVDALRGASQAATNAIIFGGESADVAAKKALAAVAAQVAGEAAFQAIRETAAGFAAYARQDYNAAGSHWTSAAIWTATGVAAGATAYGINQSLQNDGAGMQSATAGGASYGGPGGGLHGGRGGGGDRSVEVSINLSGGLEQLFNAVQEENRNRERHGEETL